MTNALSSFFGDVMRGDEEAILMVAAVYVVLVGLVSLAFQIRILFWPMTHGTLIHSDLARWGGVIVKCCVWTVQAAIRFWDSPSMNWTPLATSAIFL